MTATLKLNKGTTERLVEWGKIAEDEPKNITEGDFTLEIDEKNLFLELHTKERGRTLEISDVNGTFGLWLHLNKGKVEKLKQILNRLGP